MVKKTYRILGIDTSLRSSGIGIIEVKKEKMRVVAFGRIHNKPTQSHSSCLKQIYNTISEIIDQHKPDHVAIEGTFFSKNAKTAMILGQARGAAIAACAQYNLSITEHSPRKVKQALTGNGSAQKDQVAKMVVQLLGLSEQPQEDAADALGIAICHHHQLKLPDSLRSPLI